MYRSLTDFHDEDEVAPFFLIKRSSALGPARSCLPPPTHGIPPRAPPPAGRPVLLGASKARGDAGGLFGGSAVALNGGPPRGCRAVKTSVIVTYHSI